MKKQNQKYPKGKFLYIIAALFGLVGLLILAYALFLIFSGAE